MLVIRPLFLAIAFGGNDGGFTGLLQRFEDTRIGIMGFVCQEGVGSNPRQQLVGTFQVAGLTSRQMERGRIAKRIHGGMNLGAQAAFAAPDGFVLVLFFTAPALC